MRLFGTTGAEEKKNGLKQGRERSGLPDMRNLLNGVSVISMLFLLLPFFFFNIIYLLTNLNA